MPETSTMTVQDKEKTVSGLFLTFSGHCKKALTFYQTCFGGSLQFETFHLELRGYTEMPVISGSLFSDRIVIHGSDLVHDEGRKMGNCMAIFLQCKNSEDRKVLLGKLRFDQTVLPIPKEDDQKLIEVTDAFDVRWVLGR